jgi:hypothetical protein
MRRHNKAIDVVTFRNLLNEYKQLEAIGGIEYLKDLMRGVPNAGAIKDYSLIVKDKSLKRKLISKCDTIVKKAYEDIDSSSEIITLMAESVEAMKALKPVTRSESNDLLKRLSDVASGKTRAIRAPWGVLNGASGFLKAGTVTILCGDAGSSKSFMMLELAKYLHDQGDKIALYELEDDLEFHLRRVMAQMDKNSHLTDDEWIIKHPKESLEAHACHQEALDQFGKRIWHSPEREVTLTEVGDWVEERAKEGCSAVFIDPVTACKGSAKPWIDDGDFLNRIKRIARDSSMRVILVTHPKKKDEGKAPSMNDLAGGAAYNRFTHCILWLQTHEPAKKVELRTALGNQAGEINRSIRICKARNAVGNGWSIGFTFDTGSLTFKEHGAITK